MLPLSPSLGKAYLQREPNGRFFSGKPMVFTQKRHVWQCKTMLFLSANHVILCHFRTKNDAHYLVRRHNALYDRLLQLHTYSARIFVQMILIFKYSSFRASAKFKLTCKCLILSQSGKSVDCSSVSRCCRCWCACFQHLFYHKSISI